MILWVVLFVLVVAISFVLATQSMKDFAEIPEDSEYGLFLIRNTQGLTGGFLTSIQADLKQLGVVISFERLIKGSKTALVVFAPKQMILRYTDFLNLLELEDYTNLKVEDISAWEVSVKNPQLLKTEQKIFNNMPQLENQEQFCWQIILSSELKPQITAILVSDDPARKKHLSLDLHNLAPQNLTKLPKAYSNAQLLKFYQERSFKKDNKHQSLQPEDIVKLLLV